MIINIKPSTEVITPSKANKKNNDEIPKSKPNSLLYSEGLTFKTE